MPRNPEEADTIKVAGAEESGTASRTKLYPEMRPAVDGVVHAVAETSDLTAQRRFPGKDLPSGIHETGTLGRFNILDILGAGGMGIVLAAYDPHLDRKVAIKILRTRGMSQKRREREAARLLREARALAQLSHPHVVTVYDAGTVDEHVFIAMEYIAGQTLRSWLLEKPRSVPDILDVYMKAGRGLAAGHAVGVIHRDFKPDNVLVGRDGRVRVIDFGLAQPPKLRPDAPGEELDSVDAAPPAPAEPEKKATLLGHGFEAQADDFEEPAPPVAVTPIAEKLTTAGALFGTPTYMAPEQHDRAEIDGRTDQFAFCVALYEALYRRLPFDGATYYELVANVTSGDLRPPPIDPAVPKRVTAAIGRGLARDPDKRFPSMDALLDALQPPTHRGRNLAGAALAAAAAATITFLAVRSTGGDAPAAMTCEGGRERLAGVWDSEVRRKVVAGLAGAARTHARQTSELAAAELDRYADDWVERRQQICRATEIDRERSPQVFDLGMRCLSERLEEVRGLVSAFTDQPDGPVVDRAVAAVRKLGSPAACANLLPEPFAAPSPAIQPVVDSIRHREAAARALFQAGRFARSAAQIAALVPEAAALGYVPLDAELQYQLAQAHNGAAKPAEAERALRETIRLAGQAKDDRLIARAYTQLLGVVGFQLARYDEAVTLEGVAADLITRAEGGDAMTADLAYYMGTAHFQKGKFDKAADSFRRALELRTKLLGPNHPDVAQAHNSLGGTLIKLGKIDDAERELERAVAIREKVLGPVHPDVGLPLSNLGAIANVRNDFAKAEKYFGRAVTILEDMLGPDHPNVALTRVNLGNLARDRKDCVAAVGELTRAIASLEKLGANHPVLVNPLMARAHCRVDSGAPADALPDADRAMAIAAEQKGDPAQLAQAKFVRARALWDSGDAGTRTENRTVARTLAEEARATLVAAGAVGASALAEVTAWQKEHP